jgi:hypothetical protein
VVEVCTPTRSLLLGNTSLRLYFSDRQLSAPSDNCRVSGASRLLVPPADELPLFLDLGIDRAFQQRPIFQLVGQLDQRISPGDNLSRGPRVESVSSPPTSRSPYAKAAGEQIVDRHLFVDVAQRPQC